MFLNNVDRLLMHLKIGLSLAFESETEFSPVGRKDDASLWVDRKKRATWLCRRPLFPTFPTTTSVISSACEKSQSMALLVSIKWRNLNSNPANFMSSSQLIDRNLLMKKIHHYLRI